MIKYNATIPPISAGNDDIGIDFTPEYKTATVS